MSAEGDPPPARIGILYPGHAAEDDYPRAARAIRPPVELAVVHTSVGRDTHEIEALLDTGAAWRLGEGARRLGPASAVMWACTSGSFVYGLDGARAQADRLAAEADAPASSTSLAFLSALRTLGLERVAVGATYPDDVVERFRRFLADGGIRVVHTGALGIMDASQGGRMAAVETLDLVLSNDHADAQAILLPDTALHSIEHLPAWQSASPKPLLTANQVTVWEGLRLAGHSAAADGPLLALVPPTA